jgi:hypothetical protein
MKRILWVSAAVVTIFALSLNAIAQPGGQGGQRAGQGQGQGLGGGQAVPGQMGVQTTPQALLTNADVRTKLTLTPAQVTALTEALRPQPGAAGGVRPTPGTQVTAEERAAQVAAQRQRTTDLWTRINGVLNAEQQTKFKEIYFQANNGMNAPQLDDWLLAVVDLTPAQKEAIAKLVTDRAAAAPQGGGGQGGLTAEERAAQRTAFVAQVNAVLTAEQRAKATALTEGAAALRTELGIRAPGQAGAGAGAAQPGGAATGRGTGAAGGGFVPGQGAWQPGQDAPARGTGAGARGGAASGAGGGAGFPRGGN